MTEAAFRIWEGIVEAFPPAPETPPAFHSERWLAAQRNAVESARAAVQGGGPSTMIDALPLPALLAPLVDPQSALSILDFGGGAGVLYPTLRDCLPDAALDLHVVETAAVCDLGRELFGADGPTFHETLPDGRFDVVHAASSLHYVADWKAMLARFAAYEPRLIVLAGLTAGDIPTFVTHQAYYGARIPVWFFARDAVIDAMAAAGYRLAYRSLLDFPYLGARGPLPMDHFPASHRLDRKCNLAFVPERRTREQSA